MFCSSHKSDSKKRLADFEYKLSSKGVENVGVHNRELCVFLNGLTSNPRWFKVKPGFKRVSLIPAANSKEIFKVSETASPSETNSMVDNPFSKKLFRLLIWKKRAQKHALSTLNLSCSLPKIEIKPYKSKRVSWGSSVSR